MLQALRVGLNPQGCLRQLIDKTDAQQLPGTVDHGHAGAHGLVQVHRLHEQVDFSGFDFGEVQHIFDQGEQLMPGRHDHVDLLKLMRGQWHAAVQLQQLRKTQDGIERGSQFMAEAR